MFKFIVANIFILFCLFCIGHGASAENQDGLTISAHNSRTQTCQATLSPEVEKAIDRGRRNALLGLNPGLAGPSTRIDKLTAVALELELIEKLINKHIIGPLGKYRLHRLLRDPITSAHVLRKRQATIQHLAEDSQLRNKLKSILVRFRSLISRGNFNNESLLSTFKNVSLGNATNSTEYQLDAASSVLAALTGTAAFSIGLDAEYLNLGVFLGSILWAVQFRRSTDISNLAAVVNTAIRLEKELQGSTDPLMQEFRQQLSLLDTHPDFKRLSFALNRVVGGNGLWSAGIRSLTVYPALLSRYYAEHVVKGLADHLGYVISLVSDLEMLIGLADFYNQHSDKLIFPEILDEQFPVIDIQNGHHPYILLREDPAGGGEGVSIPNSIRFDSFHNTQVVMGGQQLGKSTWLRMMGLLTNMAQTVGFVTAQEMRFTPFSGIVMAAPRSDSTENGISTFRQGARRISSALNSVSSDPEVRMLILINEASSGASAAEIEIIDRALVEYILSYPNVILGLVTQLRDRSMFEKYMPKGLILHGIHSGDPFRVVKDRVPDYNAVDTLREMGAPREFLDIILNQ